MDHAYELPAIRAPNAQGNKAQRVFQMEAQLALNQLVFEADQRKQHGHVREGASGSPLAVKNMHEASSHATEAQRLANQLLHRMMRQGSPEYSSGDNETAGLPPLRTAPHRSAQTRPTLETAMRYAVAPSPVTAGPRDGTSPKRAKSSKRQSSKPPRAKQADHQTPQAHVLSREPDVPTQPHLTATDPPEDQGSAYPPTPSSVSSSALPPSSRANDVMRLTSKESSNTSRATPLQRETISQRVVQQRASPVTQLVESEAVERSIAITMWELERNKLYQRIAKAIAVYFLWLVDDLDEEMLGARGDLLDEEERRRTMIWNRYEIKNKAFVQRRFDDFYKLERREREELVNAERMAHVELPKRSGHDKFVIYETENHDRKEVFSEERLRRQVLKTKFQMREALMNESSLRKWIETLEDETFESSVLSNLNSCWQFEVGSASVLRREQSGRASIAAEYDADVPYFDRYQTQLTNLGGDDVFWNEKRDIEYHENLRRLFSVSGEHQERLELYQTFTTFMQMRGALLSRATVQMILENEWMRRGLVVATEFRAFSTFLIAHARVVNDDLAERSYRVRQGAYAAINNHNNEPRYAIQRELEDHESIRRAFITREEAVGAVKLRQLLVLLEEADEQPTRAASHFSALLPDDPVKGILFSEAQRRAYVQSKEHLERRAYASVCTSAYQELLEDALHEVTRHEGTRRCFLERSEGSSWHLLRKLHDDEIKWKRRFALSKISQNEDLRRDLLCAQEVTDRRRLQEAYSDGSDDEVIEAALPVEQDDSQNRHNAEIDLCDLFQGEDDNAAPTFPNAIEPDDGAATERPSSEMHDDAPEVDYAMHSTAATDGHDPVSARSNELLMEARELDSLERREAEIAAQAAVHPTSSATDGDVSLDAEGSIAHLAASVADLVTSAAIEAIGQGSCEGFEDAVV